MTEVRLEKVVLGGETLGRLPSGEVVLVEGGLPGELVVIGRPDRRQGVARASVGRVAESSPHRIARGCTVTACPGCPWQEWDLASQRRAKETLVREALQGLGGRVEPALGGSTAWGYRRRVRLHSDGRKLGYYRARSREVIAFQRCPVLDVDLERATRELATKLAGTTVTEVRGTRGEDGIAFHLVVDGKPPELPELRGVKGIVARSEQGTERRRGDPALTLDGLRADPGVFVQANAEANALLVETVLAMAARRRAKTPGPVLELYAGIGNFSVHLARKASAFWAVESAPDACMWLQQNLGAAGRVVRADAAEGAAIAAREGLQPEGVVLDPPREGAGKDAIDAIAGLQPRWIVYVSCDPATLKRDLEQLAKHGYALEVAQPLDLMPQTPHIEVVALLCKADATSDIGRT